MYLPMIPPVLWHITPAPWGVFRKPPLFLKHGDVMAVGIEGPGGLRNHMVQSGLSLPSNSGCLKSGRSSIG